MSSKPLVCVIIPFFNAEKFFQETIESVFAQTYNNWELLLVDDGSTDSSTEIALQYAEKYPMKVRYLEHDGHQNRGKSTSRNLGIRKAKGDYIAFLDADDVWLPLKLERQVAILEAHPEVGMVYGSSQIWFSWTGHPEDMERDQGRILGVQPNTLVKPPALLALFLLGTAKTPATCGVLLRREVIEEVDGFEETVQHIYEDQAFFAKVCFKFPVFVESGCWDRYRQHPDSCCYVAIREGKYHPLKPNSAHLAFLNWVGDYLSKQGAENTEVWAALQKSLWPYHHPILYYLLKSSQNFLRRTLPVSVRRWLKNLFKTTQTLA